MSKTRKPDFSVQSILDLFDNPFVIIDESYTIVEANKAYCAFYGKSPADIIGTKCHVIHHHSEFPCHNYGEECPMQRVMESGRRHKVTHLHHNHEHPPEHVTVKGFPLTDNDGKHYLGEEIVQSTAKPDAEEIKPKEVTEAEYIARLLVKHHGHRRTVAEILNVSERTLYRKLVNYKLTNVGRRS